MLSKSDLDDIREGVWVILPAYNAEKTLVRTINEIPGKLKSQKLIVDDFSVDNTVKIARKIRVDVVSHSFNKGYGAAQKTGYIKALSHDAEIIILLHADYQYNPSFLIDLIKPIQLGECDIMLGSRMKSREEAFAGGMPKYKYFGNRILTLLANLVTGQNLSEYHTGLRAFKGKVLKSLPIDEFSDDFIFDQEILVSAIGKGYRIGEIQVPVRYFSEASSISFSRSVRYGLLTILLLIKYALSKKSRLFTIYLQFLTLRF